MGFIPDQWEAAIADWPVMRRYQGADHDALRNMAFRFFVRKTIISGVVFSLLMIYA
ncbi:MAG: Mlc titration factor MtfA (ptsG expression regulator) [Pseudomonadales bacterium]|jgi:Mlc titration factor MtfA (ptsG expression regulator)